MSFQTRTMQWSHAILCGESEHAYTDLHTYTHTHRHIFAYTNRHTHAHTHTHRHIYAYAIDRLTHAHTHTHTRRERVLADMSHVENLNITQYAVDTTNTLSNSQTVLQTSYSQHKCIDASIRTLLLVDVCATFNEHCNHCKVSNYAGRVQW